MAFRDIELVLLRDAHRAVKAGLPEWAASWIEEKHKRAHDFLEKARSAGGTKESKQFYRQACADLVVASDLASSFFRLRSR